MPIFFQFSQHPNPDYGWKCSKPKKEKKGANVPIDPQVSQITCAVHLTSAYYLMGLIIFIFKPRFSPCSGIFTDVKIEKRIIT